MLLCRANQVVSTRAIIDELWGERAPRSASTVVQTYVYQLRKFLRAKGVQNPEETLQTDCDGYRLRVAEDQLDVASFEKRAQRGRQLLDEGRPREALEPLSEAMALWRGPALGNVNLGPTMFAYVAHLDEAALDVRRMRLDAQFQLGWHRAAISELTMLSHQHPFTEWVHERLAEALSRAGRRADALRMIQRFRTNLARDVAALPSSSLQDLELEVLDARIPIQGLDMEPAGSARTWADGPAGAGPTLRTVA